MNTQKLNLKSTFVRDLYRKRHSVFQNSNDDLSRKASAIIRILTDADDAHRDLGLLYAPSECYGDVNRAIQKRIQE